MATFRGTNSVIQNTMKRTYWQNGEEQATKADKELQAAWKKGSISKDLGKDGSSSSVMSEQVWCEEKDRTRKYHAFFVKLPTVKDWSFWIMRCWECTVHNPIEKQAKWDGYAWWIRVNSCKFRKRVHLWGYKLRLRLHLTIVNHM